MRHSPQPFALGLLAVVALASAAAPAAVSAHPASHTRHHGAQRHAAGRRQAATQTAGHGHVKACRGRKCSLDTGGTPAAAPAGPGTTKASRRPRLLSKQTSPKQDNRKAATPPVEPRLGKHRPAAENTAAVIAGVLATPCANTELMPAAEDLALVRTAVLCLINRERAEHGLKPLALNPRLEAAAEGHCAELISANYFAHISPSGETPVDRARKTGFIPGPSVGYVLGENLAWGTYSLATPQSIVSAWIASPGHLANILESRYTETGIGVIPAVPASLAGGSPGASYAQEFGVIIH